MKRLAGLLVSRLSSILSSAGLPTLPALAVSALASEGAGFVLSRTTNADDHTAPKIASKHRSVSGAHPW